MEIAASEFEDDLFFADLSKQINLLIMDDEDDDHHYHQQYPLANCPLVSLEAFSHAIIEAPAQARAVYEAGCKRESKGTGVFIPQSTLPRRKQRQPRFNAKATQLRQHQQDHHFHQRQQSHHATNIVVSQHVTSHAYASLNPKFNRPFN